MALSAAERAKKYRDNLKSNPQRHQEYLKKERERYQKRKQNGEYGIGNKSNRDKRLIRRKWRTQKKNQRDRQKQFENGLNYMVLNSPNSTADESTEQAPVASTSIQKQRGRKKQRRDIAKAYRRIKQLEKELEKRKKDADKYRKRWERIMRRTETEKRKKKESKVKKRNLLHEILVQQLREKYARAKDDRTKQSLSKIIPKVILKKYGLVKEFSKATGIGIRRINTAAKKSDVIYEYEKVGRSVVWTINMKRKVANFLRQDMNSTATPGKKDTITRKKIKKQKRYLNDTLQNLHQKFNVEFPDSNLSYASFCKFKPFWFVHRQISERDSCLCKLHENVRFRVEKLFQHKLIETKSADKLCETIVCDMKREACALGDCNRCKAKRLSISLSREEDESHRLGKIVTYCNWATRLEEYEKEGTVHKIQKTVKEECHETLENLIAETEELLRTKYCRHLYNIRHQFTSLRMLKETLNNEAVIHVDFSENYGCKLSDEIQGMHFGGSRNQVSLHTVVVYTKDEVNSFCTISDNTHHGPGAIWAHLKPVLHWLQTEKTHVNSIHFISDGPTSQYRSKQNFFLYNAMMRAENNFIQSTWNFTEAGHGKGAADGIGGVVKRTADNLVSLGNDIKDGKDMFEKVKKSVKNIHFFYIESSDIEAKRKEIPNSLQPIKGTMKIHQVITRKHELEIHLRTLSCFCKWPQECLCHTPKTDPKLHKFQVGEQEIVNEDADHSHKEDGTDFGIHADPEILGKWCAVKYDGKIYPGIIQDMDHRSAEVKCMHSVGRNRFFWPRQQDDIIWYTWKNVLMLIDPPKNVTGRHVQICPTTWDKLQKLI